MKSCGNFLTHKRMILILIIFCDYLQALQENINYDIWKRVHLNRTILEDTTRLNMRISVKNLLLCAMGSLATKTANAFCIQNGLCHAYSIEPCRVLFDVKSEEDVLTCYSNIDFEVLPRMYRKASYQKYIGCYWRTTVKLTWEESNNKCKEDGGQLASLENFPSREELDKTGILASVGEELIHIGFIRKGVGADFTWITGTKLETSFFLWISGEPNNDDTDTICGTLKNYGMIDDFCQFELHAFCHIPPA